MMDLTFYKDRETRTLRPELFLEVAEDWARTISGVEGKNKRTQLRKFYDEVTRLNGIAKTSHDEWDNIHPYVNMMVAKVTYALGRYLVSDQFVSFMKGSISQVKAPADLDVFANLFEAFMGFYRHYRKEER